jgi:carbon-monoxide dehydrogenase large subunit
VLEQAEAVLARARKLAGHLLEIHEDDAVAGVPDRAVSWAQLGEAASDGTSLPDGWEPGLASAGIFRERGSTYPFGAHVSVVEVDSSTGDARVVRHVAVDDCGRILNPLLVDGQVHGGLAQGMGQALFEEVLYDELGNPLSGIPSAAELPGYELDHTQTSTPLNPLGAKGIGEAATIGSTPAVQNAVVDALSHLGVRHLDMPLTPERVLSAIRASRRGGGLGEASGREPASS